MFQIQTSMSNSTTSLSEELPPPSPAVVSSRIGTTRIHQDFVGNCLNNPLLLQQHQTSSTTNILTTTPITPYDQPKKIKKKRNLPGNPDPDAEVIALSPKTLLATNRFICEICNKGFQRDQNLQLHRRGHNLPWKLKQTSSNKSGVAIKKKAYVCPEPSCVHHLPTRALGDLTGIKKHYSRKHGEKKYKCEKCGKVYAVQSDWKAHSKTCGSREYTCDCGTIFSRKDSFITHRAFCDALAEESARLSANNPSLQSFSLLGPHRTNTQYHHTPPLFPTNLSPQNFPNHNVIPPTPWVDTVALPHHHPNPNDQHHHLHVVKPELHSSNSSSLLFQPPPPPLTSSSTTAPHNNNKSLLAPPFTSHLHPHGASATSSAPPAHLSATALLQKACKAGITTGNNMTPHTSQQGGHHHVTTTYNNTLSNGSNEIIDDHQFGGGPLLLASHVSTTTDHDQYMAASLTTTTTTSSSLDLTAVNRHKSSDGLTRDFLGLTGHDDRRVGYGGRGGGSAHVGVNMQGLLKFSTSGGGHVDFAVDDDSNDASGGGVGIYQHLRGHDHSSSSLLASRIHHQGFGFSDQQPPTASETWGHC